MRVRVKRRFGETDREKRVKELEGGGRRRMKKTMMHSEEKYRERERRNKKCRHRIRENA